MKKNIFFGTLIVYLTSAMILSSKACLMLYIMEDYDANYSIVGNYQLLMFGWSAVSIINIIVFPVLSLLFKSKWKSIQSWWLFSMFFGVTSAVSLYISGRADDNFLNFILFFLALVVLYYSLTLIFIKIEKNKKLIDK